MRRKTFDISVGSRCPYCESGRIRKLQGKYGDFYSCDRYPHCAFTQSAEKTDKNWMEKEADRILGEEAI